MHWPSLGYRRPSRRRTTRMPLSLLLLPCVSWAGRVELPACFGAVPRLGVPLRRADQRATWSRCRSFTYIGRITFTKSS
jgi:hypothetical protein